MSEAAVSNDEFTAFWNSVLVEKFERFRNIPMGGQVRGRSPLASLLRSSKEVTTTPSYKVLR